MSGPNTRIEVSYTFTLSGIPTPSSASTSALILRSFHSYTDTFTDPDTASAALPEIPNLSFSIYN